MKIFVSWPGYSRDDSKTGARLVAAGHEIIHHPKLGNRAPAELLQLARGSAAAIVSTDPFTREVLESLPDLRIIARVGVGYDSIDQVAATERGVAISITPGMNAETVADHTLGLILGLIRKVAAQDASVKAGRWDRIGPMTPSELPGKVIGLVGAGTIGKAVARRLAGFGVQILFFDAAVEEVPGANKVGSLEDLLGGSDIVSLHAPLLEGNKHLINERTIALMKQGAVVINTARGGLVDQEALFGALQSGRLGGAGLDVFDKEPPNAPEISGIPNLVVSAHVGGISLESVARMTQSATNSVLEVLAGRLPDTVINRLTLVHRG